MERKSDGVTTTSMSSARTEKRMGEWGGWKGMEDGMWLRRWGGWEEMRDGEMRLEGWKDGMID